MTRVTVPAVVRNFWETFAPTEARFGMITEGEHEVHVLDVQAIRASNNFKLLDSGLIGALTVKPEFDLAFDQDVLAIVFQDEEGRVLIDRRSSVGWLHNDDAMASPTNIQKYGLVESNDRFTKHGVGIQNSDKTESCANMASRLFNACKIANIKDMKGAELRIIVEERINPKGKKTYDVVGYYPPKITLVATNGTPVAASSKPTVPAGVVEDDDLPF